MMKMLILVFGLVAGAASTFALLASEPEDPSDSVVPTDSQSARTRLRLLKARFNEAVNAGQRAQTHTEEQLKRKLEMYQKSGPRDGTNAVTDH